MHKIIEAVIPEADTTELTNRIADLEATIARKRRAIALNSADLFELPAGPLREAMKRQLGEAAAEIESQEAELEALRKTAKLIGQENIHSSTARFEAAKAKLSSSDPDERLRARRKLAQELRLRVDRVELQPDRTMVVRINDGRGGETLVELTFTTDGLTCIRYFRGDRAFRLGGPAELALIELARENAVISRILGNLFLDFAAVLRGCPKTLRA